ncbi:hypothetical protein B4U45_19985 [Mycobacterium persicum]|uniref:Uncharacterized protein n=1 Tax=Mycobacterium persicum TaxID=1487726 RepID=A0A8E2IV60_9MYCO|nr:hypothetical protein A4G31_18850 [Mycobacterium persicum]ORB52069.1 hypothetical protein BST40_09665 [Mycobacterium persicum]ORB91125.1 hypothetical protein B1T49_19920 [Mycobacterium persicum]ORB96425.1 hypothetical protein B1T44_20165 [Mycobacterium persicum]ORC03122.1 hypothetical protein B1T48_19610 [Mycobacterium persicum]
MVRVLDAGIGAGTASTRCGRARFGPRYRAGAALGSRAPACGQLAAPAAGHSGHTSITEVVLIQPQPLRLPYRRPDPQWALRKPGWS